MTKERSYHLDSVNIKTGERTRLTRFPMTHAQICTIKSKCTDYPHRRLEHVADLPYETEEQTIEAMKGGL